MRFLVIARPKFPIPPDQVLALTEGAKQWYDRYEGQLEAFGNFASGGGFGVVDATDETSLLTMLWEMPFIPFSEVTVDAFLPGKAGFDVFADTVKAMMQQMQGGAPA